MRLLPLFICSFTVLYANPCVEYFTDGGVCKEYLDQSHDRYIMADLSESVVYYKWDNTTPCDYDAIADDPLLVIRSKLGAPSEPYDIQRSWVNWTRFSHFRYPESTAAHEESLDSLLTKIDLSVSSEPDVLFDHAPIEFAIPHTETVRWQISANPKFDTVISSLDRLETGIDKVVLDCLAQTFINTEQIYFFRYLPKDGQWSNPVSFKALKPKAVDPHFEEMIISWEKEPGVQYWVFASNAIDFVPDIYTDKQLDFVDGSMVRTSHNDNLKLVTGQSSIQVDDELCFYRVVAEKNGIYSVPSPLIYVYSATQVPQRTALQHVDANHYERALFPTDQSDLVSVSRHRMEKKNIKPPQATNEAWDAVQPWIMPLNHAARGPLDRIFSKSRVLKDAQSLLDAGFDNSEPGSGSQTIVTSHKKVPHYLLKLYLDSQTGVSDWESWTHRALGAQQAREAIKKHKFYAEIVAPYKWIYPLPVEPFAEVGSEGKNFILVVDHMPLLSKKESLQRWNKDMNKRMLKAIYVITEELGLVNASVATNLPWERNLRNVFVDFEHHHVWPTNIANLKQWLRPEMKNYLDELIQNQ